MLPLPIGFVSPRAAPFRAMWVIVFVIMRVAVMVSEPPYRVPRSLVTKGGTSAALLIQRDSQQLFVPVELGQVSSLDFHGPELA